MHILTYLVVVNWMIYCAIALVFLIIGFTIGWILAPDEPSIYMEAHSGKLPEIIPSPVPPVAPPIGKMVDAFLMWPLPESVCADRCATIQGPNRIGTNLLSFDEARQMFEHVLAKAATVEISQVCEQPEVSIIVNAQLCKCNYKEISYDQVVGLARKKPRGARAGRVMTVTYSHKLRSGSLLPGASVTVEKGMIFNVADTSNA